MTGCSFLQNKMAADNGYRFLPRVKRHLASKISLQNKILLQFKFHVDIPSLSHSKKIIHYLSLMLQYFICVHTDNHSFLLQSDWRLKRRQCRSLLSTYLWLVQFKYPRALSTEISYRFLPMEMKRHLSGKISLQNKILHHLSLVLPYFHIWTYRRPFILTSNWLATQVRAMPTIFDNFSLIGLIQISTFSVNRH